MCWMGEVETGAYFIAFKEGVGLLFGKVFADCCLSAAAGTEEDDDVFHDCSIKC